MTTKTICKTGLKRDTIDKFYTQSLVVDEFANHIRSKLTINKENDLIIEPSAGNGAFINNIKQISNNYKFYDIKPESIEIKEQDFLTLNYQTLKDTFSNIHIIGNPPFGRQASLALKFIKYSAKFCKSISFILPRSFKKESMKNKIPHYFHLIFEDNITEENPFILEGKSYSVPCIYQIWEKRDTKRIIKEKEALKNGYKFVKKCENPTISFRRVGVKAGNIDKITENKSPQSHYFIKIDEELFTDDLYQKIKGLSFNESGNTIGPKSISKPELIREFNKHF